MYAALWTVYKLSQLKYTPETLRSLDEKRARRQVSSKLNSLTVTNLIRDSPVYSVFSCTFSDR